MATSDFDVFVSYHSANLDAAVELAETLTSFGLRVWFDKSNLRPGQPWIDRLHAGLAVSRSVAVLIGKEGIGPWEAMEIRVALSNFAKRGQPVVPILLTGADLNNQLLFLDQFTWVDCRVRQISHDSLERIVWGITGRHSIKAVSQLGESFSLKIPRHSGASREVTVYTLPNRNPNRLLDLTWETFGRGIEILTDQIKNYGYHLPIDAALGINDAGLAMAAFVNSHVLNRAKLGYLRCDRALERTAVSPISMLPPLERSPTLMVFDFEVKASNVLGNIVKHLRSHYEEPRIYFAVFGALTESEDLRLHSFDQLVSSRNLMSLGLEDVFIACTMHSRGIEPPLGLR